MANLKGVHDFMKEGNEMTFQVDTEELDAIIRHMSPYGIVKLESAPPTLEDLFMRHYKEAEPENRTPGGTV